jgi:hypothetical protein
MAFGGPKTVNDCCYYAYLYFRLLEYVNDHQQHFRTDAEIGLWEDDQMLLNFLAHRALIDYPAAPEPQLVRVELPSFTRKPPHRAAFLFC